VIFDGEEKARLEAFVTRDARTRRLSWEAIVLEMGYACSAHTVKGYKRIAKEKFLRIREKRVAWCQARLPLDKGRVEE